MKANLSALGAGFVFGLGLWLSGMADPRKVLGFLDVAGNWDPSLLLVMGGAVAVTATFTLPVVLKRSAPLLGGAFQLPARSAIDAPLLLGAAIFGLGWGIGGYCPGPALTALSNLTVEAFVFVAAMIAGGVLEPYAQPRGLPLPPENT
ncbi:MAG: DUF6691 family protein [Burkholderiales bacterium]